jgi:hypothetical protein
MGNVLFRFVIRLLALLLLAGAFVAAVIDGARSIGSDELAMTSLGVTLYWALPSKFPLLQPLIEGRFGQRVWDPVMLTVLKAPTLVVLAAMGAGLLFLVRRRPPPIGYSARRR